MTQVVTSHPTTDLLVEFLQGRLPRDQQDDIERHIAGCTSCCAFLETVPDDTLLDQLRAADTANEWQRLQRFVAAAPRSEVPRELAAHPRYRVVKQLGEGGMGVVYQAEHRLMERAVALKVVHRHLLSHPIAVERFQLEVKSAARLSHPNIVAAHDADQAGELHFLVMEFVEGASLAELVEKQGPFTVGAACAAICQAAQGLEHARTRGMVHRDIKPQNLMRTLAGEVKVLDFGLATFVRAQQNLPVGQTLPLPPPGLTHAGMLLGTPDYMAPEQAANAREVDIRADIYSLGCTLFFLLTGETLFPTGSAYEKMFAHGHTSPCERVRAVRGLPGGVAEVLLRMLAKEPDQRPQTPAEVAAALTPFVQMPTRPKPTSHPPRRSSLARAGTFALAMLVLFAGSWWLAWNLPAREDSGEKCQVVPFAQEPRIFNGDQEFLPVPVQENPGAKGTSAQAVEEPRIFNGGQETLPLLVVLAQEYQPNDYEALKRVIGREGGWPIRVASSARTPCKPQGCFQGAQVVPDYALPDDKIRAANFAGVVVPGGFVHMFKEDRPPRRALWKLLDETAAANKCIAGIDSGLLVLSMAGKLQNHRVAMNPRLMEFERFRPSGAIWVREGIVQDGPLLTAAGSQFAPEFARRVLKHLQRGL